MSSLHKIYEHNYDAIFCIDLAKVGNKSLDSIVPPPDQIATTQTDIFQAKIAYKDIQEFTMRG